MNNPISSTQPAGYPSVAATTGTPYGQNLEYPRTSTVDFRGGPNFGLASVSEPNTSPDTLTVHVRVDPEVWKLSHLAGKSDVYVPSGTPVLLQQISNGVTHDRHGEPIHTINFLTPQLAHGSVSVCETADGNEFITVMVGDATLRKNKHNYIAVAIQNVATVSLLGQAPALKNIHIGDKLYIVSGPTPATTQFITSALPNTTNKLMRVMTVTATAVGATIKCDLGVLVRGKA